MEELAEDLMAKARHWQAEAKVARLQWRPMCELLAREYERLARERQRDDVASPVTDRDSRFSSAA